MAIPSIVPILMINEVNRGVQYVHCVMHKSIMVKVGGNKIHIKYVKIRQILRKQERNLQK